MKKRITSKNVQEMVQFLGGFEDEDSSEAFDAEGGPAIFETNEDDEISLHGHDCECEHDEE